MLERILAIIEKSGTRSKADLARQLEISEDALEHLIAQLVSRGYLRIVDSTCDGACGGCSLAGGSVTKEVGRFWVLTEKGALAIG